MAPLKANNIKTSEVSGFTPQGQPYRAERLTFYVGNNGPYSKEFPAQTDNTAAMQQYITEKVRQLNALQASNQ